MNSRKSSLITIVWFVVLSLCINCCLPAGAGPLIYTPPTATANGSFQGEVPVKQIGPLLLPRAVVQFKDNEVSILAVPDWLFDRNLVLSGVLVKGQVNVQGESSDLRGLVYFLGGMWLSNLGSANAIDVVDTVSGETLRGRIRSRLDNAFAFKPDNGPMRKLLFTDIENINSPRAYMFSAPAALGKVIIDINAPSAHSSPPPLYPRSAADGSSPPFASLPSSAIPTPSAHSIPAVDSQPANSLQFDSNTISFVSTMGRAVLAKKAKIPQSNLAGTEPGITKAEIGTFIGLNIANELAPAIAIPLVLNGSAPAYAKRKLQYFQTTQSNFAFPPSAVH